MLTNYPPHNANMLKDWLIFELQTERANRSELEQDWIRYEQVYRARPKSKVKDFPFQGAANLVIDIAATDVDTTVAGLLGVLFGSPNLWSCEALKPEMLDYAPRLEEFLEWAQEQELGMYNVMTDFILQLTKLGTSIMKQRYRREQKLMYQWREGPQGTIEQMQLKLKTDRPDVQVVSLANFYLPATALNIQDSPWVAERLELTWTQLENRVKAGIYLPDSLYRIGAFWRGQQAPTPYNNFQSAQEQLDHFLPSFRDKFELFEFNTEFDIFGIGEPVKLICTIHEPTQTYLRIDLNPAFNQEYQYSAARFLRQNGRFYGIGLCEILEMKQEEISTMHNQRIDNGTIRNTTLFKAQKGTGVKADEPIWPGRIFLVEDINQFEPMPMGYESGSTLPEEMALIDYARSRSGVSDYQRGGAGNPAISYSTATTTVQMLQQGRLRLDQTLREVQAATSETGQRVVEMYQQYNPGGKPYLVMGAKDGQLVEEVLRFPLDTIRMGVAIKVTATNAQLNKETKIRTDQIIYGMVNQMYTQLFQAMAILVNPQYPPAMRVLAAQMMQGGLILSYRILDSYGQQDIDRILPDMEQLNGVVQQLIGLGVGPQPAIGAGGGQLGPGPSQASGLPALPAGVSGMYGTGLQQTPAFQGP